MLEIIDKLLLFVFCTLLYVDKLGIENAPVAMIIVITLSGLCTYFEKGKINRFSVLFFVFLSIFFPHLNLFLPLILYDVFCTEEWKYSGLSLVPILMHRPFYDLITIFYIIFLMGLSFFAKMKTYKVNTLQQEYYTYRDNAKELEILLEKKNHKLLENQDYQVHMATLKERNRIAKEIHDNIGHLLSRSLLHIAALLIRSKEEETKKELTLLQSSLSQGMDSIRVSIHNMHDESIDLYAAIENLVKDFRFCTLHFDYNIHTPPPLPLKYFFISTIREGLANMMKHSNGSQASIILTEHPIMYQLIIYDNGQLSETEGRKVKEINQDSSTCEGLGLRSIIERVQGLNGIIQISGEKGFKIFITIPIHKVQEG